MELPLSVLILMALVMSIGRTPSSVEATRKMSRKPPLIAEDSHRKNRRAAECQFGKKTYELEETWHPDLGPPFGTMYCIRCECIPVQKKQRISGRTLCKNIKNECPKLSCDEPILLPGSCCKVCPDEAGLGPLKEDISFSKEPEEDDKQGKDFAAILTSASSGGSTRGGAESLDGVATARFTFRRRNLYFSIVKNSPISGSRVVQFIKEDGSIIEEQELAANEYSDATGKVCGVWRKVPRVYRQLLREEKLHIVLMDGKDSEPLTGRLSRYKALSSELLSALLVSDTGAACAGCGGTAAVSIAGSTNSVHITVAVKGLIAKNADGDVLLVRLETIETGSHPSRVIEELVTVQKAQEVNVIEVRTVLESQEMRQLMRGHVILIVQSKTNPSLRLRGAIGPRVTCDLWDSLITPSDSSPVSWGQHAVAWFYIGRNGLVHYHVNLANLDHSVSSITIETSPSKNKRKREIEDITGSLGSFWANGTLRLSAKDYELLYEDELYISLATGQPDTELRGKISLKVVSESHLEIKSGPASLSTSEGSNPGLVWANVDSQCIFHYEVDLKQTKKDQQEPSLLEFVHVPPLNGRGLPNTWAIELAYATGDSMLSPTSFLLEEFTNGKAENSFKDLAILPIARLAAGSAYLKVTEPKSPNLPRVELQGWLKNVKVPETCMPNINTADFTSGGPSDQSLGSEYILEKYDDNEIPQTRRCFYESKFYEDGSQWNALHDRCSMCSCHRGRVVCDAILCPALKCGGAAVVKRTGECCPACENVTAHVEPETTKGPGCFVAGDHKLHLPGSQWHPYIPPFGFSKCAVCTCNPLTLEVECNRITCAPLQCLESEAFRPDPLACCKQCPSPTLPALHASLRSIDPDILDEEAQSRSEAEIIASGGCRFKGEVFDNGEEWHPRVQPWGEMKCINCNCKEGKVKCKRKKCPKNKCARKTQMSHSMRPDDDCCPLCPEEGSYLLTTKKPRRGENNRIVSGSLNKKNKPREDKNHSGRNQKLKRIDS